MASNIFIVLFLLCVSAWHAHASVNCTSTGAGRHADPTDTTCRNYTLCIYVQVTNNYLSYDAICPGTTVFNTKVSKCTAPGNFVCTVNTTTINPPKKKSVCSSEGLVADPNPTNCSTYIECVDFDGVYTETNYVCPNKTYFNPNTTLCEPNYNCTQIEFTCSSPGRAADVYDFTCQKYYFCVELLDGSYIQYNYTCPGTSMFNPSTKLCTTRYVCT